MAMLQQAVDFREESEALYALLAPLSESELQTKTAFKGWTLNDVVGHLFIWNQAAELTLRDSEAFKKFFKEVISSGSLRAFEQKKLSSLHGQALVKAWREQFLAMSELYGKADPSHRVKWAGPDMTVRSKITARLMETWAHGQEIYDQLGQIRKCEDRIQNIVILGVNTFGWTYKVSGLKVPGAMPYLRLESPSGQLWTFGEPSTDECIEGMAEEFCQVVTQTRNIADTDLKVVGPTAQDWMSRAQCFAGGPETPPAPGTRKLVARL